MEFTASNVSLVGAKILVVDDIAENRKLLCNTLEPEGYKISAAPSGEVALKVAQASPPDLILLDLMMPGMNGFEVCRTLKANDATKTIPVIFITADNETESLLEGFRAGGVDYITKPFHSEEVLIRVKTHLENSLLTHLVVQKNQELRDTNERLRAESERRERAEAAQHRSEGQLSLISDLEAKRWGIQGFIGRSQTFAKILDSIRRLQNFDRTNVLITGESGTGKELIARAIHFGSQRAKAPFIPVNCAAIPRDLAESLLFGHTKGSFTGALEDRQGYFELADGGTLFLDEIGELPLETQPKLLRVLEDSKVVKLGSVDERPVEVRVITASNIDFKSKIAEGAFREDLYFRLAGFTIDAPPLRDRKEDIPLLAKHFLGIYSVEMAVESPPITEAAMDRLTNYPFPGNVRELKNTMERALVESGDSPISPDHLHFFYGPDEQSRFNTSSDAPSPLDSDENKLLAYVTDKGSINNTECRTLLNVERNRASYLLKKLHGIGQLKCQGSGRWAIYVSP